MTGYAPGPVVLLGIGLCTLAFATDHPVTLAALALCAVLLHRSAPRRRAVILVAGVAIGVAVAVLNPFVQANGDLILFALPDIPVVDLQVTVEEVVAGLALGLRAFAVTVTIGAVLAHADPDRLLSAAGRLAPRSALTASIAARLLPTLERDAGALIETMRLRGHSPRHGSWTARTRAAGALTIPLLGSALDRSLDVAEAMAGRAYGSGPATRSPTPPWRRPELLVAGVGLGLLALGLVSVAGSVGGYRFYPTLGYAAGRGDLATAGTAVTMTLLACGALRR